MPNRTIVTRLTAETSGYTAGMARASASTTAFAAEARGAGTAATAGLANADRAAARTATSMRATEAAAGRSAAGMTRTGAAATAAGAGMSRAGSAARDAEGRFTRAGAAAAGTASGLGRTGSAAAGAATGLGRAEGAAARTGSRMATLEHGAGAAGVSLRTLGLGGAAAVAVGLGAAVKVAGTFEKKMATVKANTDLGSVSFDKLTEAIKTQGTQFGFSALESADAADDLAKAGLNAQQIIGGGLTGALTLAAAGNISAGEAAETAATAMTMFGLASKDIPHIADLLAAGADKSTASVHSLSEGLMEGGSLAHLMGVSIEDTTAVLAEFDQSGLKGAKAGNALKTMFQNLLDPTAKQKKTMDELNLSFFDANGKFIGLSAMAGQLQKQMGGLDDKSRNAALSILFGARSVQAANILYKDGAKGVKHWQEETNEAGFATQNATKKLQSLAGDLNKAKSQAVNFGIDIGGKVTPMLRQLTQFSTNALGGLTRLTGGLLDLGSVAGGATLGHLPSSMQSAALAMGVAAVASKLLGSRLDGVNQRMRSFGSGAVTRVRALGTTMREASTATGAMVQTAQHGAVPMGRFGSAIERVGQSSRTINQMQSAFVNAAMGANRLPRAMGAAAAATIGMRSAARGVVGALGGPFGAALTVGVIGLSLWQKHQQDAAQKVAQHKANVQELTAAIKEDGHAIGDATRQQLVDNLAKDGALEKAKKYGISMSTLAQAAMGNKTALSDLTDQTVAYTKKTDSNNVSLEKVHGKFVEVDAGAAVFAQSIRDLSGTTAESIRQDRLKTAALEGSKQAYVTTKADADAYALAAKRVKDAQTGAAKAADDLKKGIDGVNNAFLEGQANEDGYEAAIDSATAALKKNGATLDKHTEKGRANREALRGIASAGLQYADSLAKEGASAQTVAAQITATRGAFVKQAVAMGASRSEAEKLAAQFIKMPTKVTTKIEADVDLAKANLNAAQAAVRKYGKNLEDLPKNVQTKVIASGGKNAKEQIDNLDKSVRHLPGQASISTKTPGAPGSMLMLKNVSAAAVDANGKSVSIPVDTPKQAQALRALMNISGAAVTADHKSVSIPSSTPYSSRTIAELKKIDGVSVSANRKSVTISTSSPGAFEAARQILSAGNAADRVNGKVARIKIVTDLIKNHIDNFEKNFGKGFFAADGAVFGSNGVRKMAAGGVSRPAMIANKPILWAEAGPEAYLPLGRNKRNPRTERILRTSADILGYDVIKRATGGIDGMRAGWDRARPVASVTSQAMTRSSSEVAALSKQVATLTQLVAAQSQVPVHASVVVDGKKLAQAVTQGNRSMRRTP